MINAKISYGHALFNMINIRFLSLQKERESLGEERAYLNCYPKLETSRAQKTIHQICAHLTVADERLPISPRAAPLWRASHRES